jgi:S-ribosylhomocysteine lyase
MPDGKPLVESFALNHDEVIAPYVRFASSYRLNTDDVPVQKFDIRFCQPNVEFMSPATAHTLEHLMATELRKSEIKERVIDISPMGCRTGFYLIVRGEYTPEKIAEIILKVLEEVLTLENEEDIPGRARIQCGNWLDHDLKSAKEWAGRWIEGIRAKGPSPFRS